MTADRDPMDRAVPVYDALNYVAESLRHRGATAQVIIEDNITTASVSMSVSACWDEDEARSIGALIKFIAEKGEGCLCGDVPGSKTHAATGGTFDFSLSFTFARAVA